MILQKKQTEYVTNNDRYKLFSIIFSVVSLFILCLSFFVNMPIVLIGLLLLISALNIVKARKNFILLIIGLILFYCNYSVCVTNFIQSGYYSFFSKTLYAYRSLQSLLLFTLVIFVCIPQKIESVNFKQIYSKRDVHILIHIVALLVLLFIIAFGYSGGGFGQRGSYNQLWGYFPVFVLIGLFFSKNNKLIKNIYLTISVIYVCLNLIFKERLYVVQIAIILVMFFCPDKLIRNKKLTILLLIVGYLIFTFIGNFRNVDGYNIWNALWINIKTSFETLFSLDTAASSFYTGQTFVNHAFLDDWFKRLSMLGLFVLSILFGMSLFPKASLPDYTIQFMEEAHKHSFGGYLPLYGYYYLGLLGVLLIALYIVGIYKMIANWNKNDVTKLLSIVVLSSTFTWYLYSPSAITRNLLLVLILYYSIIVIDNILKKVFCKSKNTNDNKNDNYDPLGGYGMSKILYVSNVCSENEYLKLFKGAKKFVSQQSQKFNRLMAEGFALNGCDVEVVSGRPVSFLQKQKIFKYKQEECNGVKYHYLGFLNFKFIRNVILNFKAKKFAKKWCKQNPNGIMFCDALNLSMSNAVSKVFSKNNMPIVTCVTDLPEDLMIGANKLKANVFTKMFNNVSTRTSKYVVLSKYMMESPNLKNKPFIVIEGFADYNLSNLQEDNNIKSDKKIIMYAGLLYKKYGVSALLNGFIQSNIKDYELHFYGVGNSADLEDDALAEILTASKQYNNIKYGGSISSQECFKNEKQATLLINPRPTNERFVKNSFPSKNMEYMSSGTPLLTTNLPSMPEEYKAYCYIIEDETEKGISSKLQEICTKDVNELNQKGQEGKRFVIENKNNKIQTKKIIDFIKE